MTSIGCRCTRCEPFSRALLIARRLLPVRPYRKFVPKVLFLWRMFKSSGNSGLNVRIREYQAAIAAGFHLFPSRTEKLSPPAPMVLHRNAGE